MTAECNIITVRLREWHSALDSERYIVLRKISTKGELDSYSSHGAPQPIDRSLIASAVHARQRTAGIRYPSFRQVWGTGEMNKIRH
jgi:hypothetical protein